MELISYLRALLGGRAPVEAQWEPTKQGARPSNTSHSVYSDWTQTRPKGQDGERQKVKEDRARAV